ncbi:MAG: hypothetical protein VKL39_18255 [Leptolyngbyaceae bacterium]|nr:hypothetical protein [Leptolyngbyaceae bacterium]
MDGYDVEGAIAFFQKLSGILWGSYGVWYLGMVWGAIALLRVAARLHVDLK